MCLDDCSVEMILQSIRLVALRLYFRRKFTELRYRLCTTFIISNCCDTLHNE